MVLTLIFFFKCLRSVENGPAFDFLGPFFENRSLILSSRRDTLPMFKGVDERVPEFLEVKVGSPAKSSFLSLLQIRTLCSRSPPATNF